MAQTETKTHIAQVGRVIVPVSDQDRALDFYTGKLGFEKISDIPYGDGDRWLEVVPPGAATGIALTTPREGFEPGINTNVAYTTKDIDAAHAALRDAGVDVDDEVMRMGGPVPPMFCFRDQDANIFLLVES